MFIKRVSKRFSAVYSRVRGFAELGILRSVTMLLNFLTIPLYLQYLGIEEFGAFSVLLAIIAFGTMFDLGVSNALISTVAISFERGDTLKMKQTVSSSLYALFVGTGAFSILAICIVVFLDIEDMFNVASSLTQDFSSSLLIALVFVAPYSFSLLPSKISLALGRAKESAIWITLTAIVTQTLSLIVVTQTQSLSYLIAAQMLTPTLIGIVYYNRILISFPCMRPTFFSCSLDSLKQVLKSGRIYFFLQIATVFSYHLDVVIVGILLDTESVSELAITWKIASIPYLLVSASLLPFWQRSALLFDKERSVEAFTLKMLKMLLPVLLSWSILFLIFGENLVAFWSSDVIYPSNVLIYSCAIWALLATFMSALSIILNGIRSTKFLLFSTGSFTVVNVLISVVVTRVTGSPAGPIVGSSIASVICFFIPLAFSFKKILNQKEVM